MQWSHEMEKALQLAAPRVRPPSSRLLVARLLLHLRPVKQEVLLLPSRMREQRQHPRLLLVPLLPPLPRPSQTGRPSVFKG